MRKKRGFPPGSLNELEISKLRSEATLIHYDNDTVEMTSLTDLADVSFPKSGVNWLQIKGLADIDMIKKVADIFHFHPLLVEDIFNSDQRSRLEEFNEGIVVFLKHFQLESQKDQLESEQLTIALVNNVVITFQDSRKNIFQILEERIQKNKGRIRKMAADYLFYALIDIIIDDCFIVLGMIDDLIEDLESELIKNPQSETLQKIYHLKREIIVLRRSVWHLRELVVALNRDQNEFMTDSTQVYLKDIYDHAIQIVDIVETFRDMISNMLEMYLTSISNKMNEVMKTLTIFAAIFIPLTFLAGVYGMNFRFLPELEWKWSYPLWWFITILIGISMIFYFKKKKWF